MKVQQVGFRPLLVSKVRQQLLDLLSDHLWFFWFIQVGLVGDVGR